MDGILGFLAKGGIIIYPLLICSILGLAIVIEKSITLRRRKIIIPEIIHIIDNIKGQEDISLAMSICKKHSGPFANIIQTGLQNKDLPREVSKELLVDRGRQEVNYLERGLVILETIAAIAPLLGLLGTVIGILKVFNVISAQGVGQAAALSGGISEALITTIVGLSIGIPAIVAYNFFTNKAEKLVLDIEKYSFLLFNKTSAIKKSKKRKPDAI